jgi:ion channel-forming bestrophin family protein
LLTVSQTERYSDGCKYWTQLTLASRNLARLIWVHVKERHDSEEGAALGKADLLAKLTALNLINAFAVSLKHRLRFEPSTEYPDLNPLVSNLQTMAGAADQALLRQRKPNALKATGEYLGLSFATSNPRKVIKQSKDNLGNLPLEILTHLQSYVDTLIGNATLSNGIVQSNIFIALGAMSDVLTGTERVLNTPLPIAYSISISQITWVYVILLPFQLYATLGWLTVPGTMFATYIILGIATIGREIENPFGNDVNDLPLDTYCRELAADIDVLTSTPAPKMSDFITNSQNKVLYPLSMSEYAVWEDRSVAEIREALRQKAISADVKVERMERSMTAEEQSAAGVNEKDYGQPQVTVRKASSSTGEHSDTTRMGGQESV